MVKKEPKSPLVSVVMPVKNAEHTVAESIDSILNQSLKELELIVINDSSTDTTGKILEDYRTRDSRIKIHLSTGQGICDARNLGLKKAQAPLYAVMDADDIALPDRLILQYAEFQTNENLVLLGTYLQTFNEETWQHFSVTMPIDNDSLKKSIRTVPTFAHPTIMARTEAVRKIGGYRKAFEGAEDHDLYVRLSRSGDFAILPEFLLNYRLHSSQITQMQKARGFRASVATVYCDMCIEENREDPSESGKSCDQIAFAMLKRVESQKEPVSKDQFTLCTRAIRGLAILPEFRNKLKKLRKKICCNLIKSGQFRFAYDFWKSTRKSKWLLQ